MAEDPAFAEPYTLTNCTFPGVQTGFDGDGDAVCDEKTYGDLLDPALGALQLFEGW